MKKIEATVVMYSRFVLALLLTFFCCLIIPFDWTARCLVTGFKANKKYIKKDIAAIKESLKDSWKYANNHRPN